MPPDDPTVIEFDVRTDEMLANMGPQHPSTHGVLRLVLRPDADGSPQRTAPPRHRQREHILDPFEDVCGARLTYSYLAIGGAHDDLPAGWTDRCRKFLDYFKPRIPEYHALLTDNHIFVKRTANVGVLSKEMALAYGCTGPMLRASLDRSQGDPDWDLRKTEPYSGYEQYQFEVPLPPFDRAPRGAVIGDCWHRFYVRMLEVVQS